MEIYKEIEGYAGYKISSRGDVLNRHSKKLKLFRNRAYPQVELYKNNIGKTYYVHRLVAISFIDNPNKYKIVNHRNGIKDDNRVENLEWCDHLKNMEHASFMYKNGCIRKSKIIKLYLMNKNISVVDFVSILMKAK